MDKRAAPESIEELTHALGKLPVRIERAILFGSRARGDHFKDSDWDVILVSDDFEGVFFPKRISRLLLAISVSSVEMFCYTPDEFEKGRDGFGIIGVAFREGINLIIPEKEGEL